MLSSADVARAGGTSSTKWRRINVSVTRNALSQSTWLKVLSWLAKKCKLLFFFFACWFSWRSGVSLLWRLSLEILRDRLSLSELDRMFPVEG